MGNKDKDIKSDFEITVDIDYNDKLDNCYHEEEGFSVEITTDKNEADIQKAKSSLEEAQSVMSTEKINECKNLIETLDENEEKDELQYHLRNLQQAKKSEKELMGLEENVLNKSQCSIEELEFLKDAYKRIKKNLVYYKAEERLKILKEKLQNIDIYIKKMEQSFGENDIMQRIEKLSNAINNIAIQCEENAKEYMDTLCEIADLNNKLKVLNKNMPNKIDYNEFNIGKYEDAIKEIVSKYKSIHIIENIIMILELKNYDKIANKIEMNDYYRSIYENKKYEQLKELKDDLVKTISLYRIKNAQNAMQVNESIIDMENIVFINSGKNNRQKISEKILKDKEKVNTIEDIIKMINIELEKSQSGVDALIDLEESKLGEALKEMVIELRNKSEEDMIEKVVAKIKTYKSRIKCIEDLKDTAKRIIETEKSKIKEEEKIQTITVSVNF